MKKLLEAALRLRDRPRKGVVVADAAGNLRVVPWPNDTTHVLTGARTFGAAGSALADDSVTNAKLANMANSKIKGRKTAGTGDPEDCSLSEILDFIGSAAQGDILYRGASGWVRLGAGTSGYFLKTLGAGADPAWAAAPAAGSLDNYAVLWRAGKYNRAGAETPGDFTTGIKLIPLSNTNVTGAEFWIAGNAVGKNVKVQIWTLAGSSLKSVTVNSVVAGVNVATFASSQAVTAGTAYLLSMYITDGTYYMIDNSQDKYHATYGAQIFTNFYAAGDGAPQNEAGTERYLINPTY